MKSSWNPFEGFFKGSIPREVIEGPSKLPSFEWLLKTSVGREWSQLDKLELESFENTVSHEVGMVEVSPRGEDSNKIRSI